MPMVMEHSSLQDNLNPCQFWRRLLDDAIQVQGLKTKPAKVHHPWERRRGSLRRSRYKTFTAGVLSTIMAQHIRQSSLTIQASSSLPKIQPVPDTFRPQSVRSALDKLVSVGTKHNAPEVAVLGNSSITIHSLRFHNYSTTAYYARLLCLWITLSFNLASHLLLSYCCFPHTKSLSPSNRHFSRTRQTTNPHLCIEPSRKVRWCNLTCCDTNS